MLYFVFSNHLKPCISTFQNAVRNSSLQLAADAQKRVDESVMRLAADHKVCNYLFFF